MKCFSVVNQKGGVGKSSITLLLVTRFFHLFFKHKIKIALIDFDPQRSIFRTREKELENNHLLEKIKSLFPNDYKERLKSLYEIISLDYRDFIKYKEKFSEEYDVLFFDFPGAEINKEVLSSMDKIILPVVPDQLDIDSTIQFLTVVNELEVSTGWFLNRYSMTTFKKYAKDNLHKVFKDSYSKINMITYAKNLMSFGINKEQKDKLVVFNERPESMRKNRSTIIPYDNTENGVLALVNYLTVL